MKTVSFHELKVGRSPANVLMDLDSTHDGVALQSGLQIIVAPNGYGKTTLLQTIAGVLNPVSGRLKLGEKYLSPESDVLYVSEYLSFPKFIYPSEWIEFMGGQADSQTLEKLKPWIEGFSLGKKLDSYMGRMSQGERRKVTWLGAHASERPVILLDEPLDGLDILAIRSARDMLKAWKSEGRVVFIVAHQVSEVLDLADQVFLVRDQKLVPWQKWQNTPASELSQEEFRQKVLEYYLS